MSCQSKVYFVRLDSATEYKKNAEKKKEMERVGKKTGKTVLKVVCLFTCGVQFPISTAVAKEESRRKGDRKQE